MDGQNGKVEYNEKSGDGRNSLNIGSPIFKLSFKFFVVVIGILFYFSLTFAFSFST